jgi:hypothetical protein
MAEPEPTRHRWPLVVLLIFLLAIAAIIAVPLIQYQMASDKDIHRVTFVMKTPGYGDEATAIPVSISGTKADGTAYAETVYLDGGGNGVVLEPGSYELTFTGGSLLPNGTALLAPTDAKLNVEVPTGLAHNAFVQVPGDQVITYTAVSPLNLNEETLNAVYQSAIADPNDNGKADELLSVAAQAHEDAVAKRKADTAAIEKKAKGAITVSTGDEAQFIGTLQICSPEEVGERIGDDNVQWNLYGHTLAVLWLDEPRHVSLQTTTSGYYGYYDDYGYWNESDSYTDTQDHDITCLVLNNDVEGIYSYGSADDGTLSSHNGNHVLVSGKISTPTDWSTSQISPITLVNPTIEDL